MNRENEPHYCVWTSAQGSKSLRRFETEAEARAASKDPSKAPSFLSKPVTASVRHWLIVENLGCF